MLSDRITDRIDASGPCWLWRGSLNRDGYGQISVNGTVHGAHRHVYELLVGPIPSGLETDHLCRVRRCVNPDHLELITRTENILRGFGPPAINARKTHCIHGHEFTPENTRPQTSGGRNCRACGRERERRYYEARKASAS